MTLKHHGFYRKATQGVITFFLLVTVTMALCVTASAQEKVLKGKTVNINTGTVEQFLQVPLITQELAENIVEYREENGDFQVIEELLQVEGFTRKLLRRLKTFFLLEGIGGDDCTC